MADSAAHLNPPIFLRLCSYARYRANVLENGGFKSIGGKPTDGDGAGGRVCGGVVNNSGGGVNNIPPLKLWNKYVWRDSCRPVVLSNWRNNTTHMAKATKTLRLAVDVAEALEQEDNQSMTTERALREYLGVPEDE